MLTNTQIIYLCIFIIAVIYIIFSQIGKARIEREVESNLRSLEKHYEEDYQERVNEISQLTQNEYEKLYLDRVQALSSREKRVQADETALEVKKRDLDYVISQEVSSQIRSGMEKARSLFLQYPIFSDFKKYDYLKNTRLYSAVTERMIYRSIPEVSAQIQGQSGEYFVTLHSCTCPDFLKRGLPCKHMFRLAFQVGLASSVDPEPLQKDLLLIKQRHDLTSAKLSKMEKQIELNQKKLDLYESGMKKITKEADGATWLAKQIADLQYLIDIQVSDRLATKTPPAPKSAKVVRVFADENRILKATVKALEYKIAIYESLVPSLPEEAEYSPEEISEAVIGQQDEVPKYLSKDEYDILPETEKWQLALDRWRARHRSNWQVGRDFERYIGYLYELDGYRVEYFGALEGKMDLGRDLIARKKKEIVIIQCKRWADRKTIHEKHVFQLFGSVVGYEMEHPGSSPKGLLITTCPLSDVAIAYAERLGIDYMQNYPVNDVDTYPLIKCNIGQTGEKIFHLPFDQQYDRVTIDQRKGEFYASTVQEAIDAGFRRAYRWHGQ